MATFKRKMKSLFYVTTAGIGAYSVIAYFKNDPKFYKYVLMPMIHLLDPENAHKLGVLTASKAFLLPNSQFRDPPTLEVDFFGRKLKNPVGIAAGFDKNGQAIEGLSKIGFGFVEIGSVTPQPQAGNEKPRVFRLKEDRAIINRYGFNNDGHEKVFERVCNIKQHNNNIILGVNLGRNKSSQDPIKDYVLGVQKFKCVADYLVINVSSPNTPGLRNMQHKEMLKNLLVSVLKARDGEKPPIFLKLAPDLDSEEMRDISEVIVENDSRIDGLIISNTTVDRPESLKNSSWKDESGGLSGQPLKDVSTKQIEQIYKLTNGKIPIIGVGGVFTGCDAYEKIKAGATLVQLYTSLVYEGPPVVTKVKKQLNELLVRNNYNNVNEAVGK